MIRLDIIWLRVENLPGSNGVKFVVEIVNGL